MIVVTGASGLIGSNLVRTLLAQGQQVRVLVHHNHHPLSGLNVETSTGDLLSFASLVQAFSGAEIVYHLAGAISLKMNHWEQMQRVNVFGTRNVVNACLQSGVRRLVHFSSIHALEQEPLDTPVTESRPRVTSEKYPPYDRSKAAGEQEVLNGVQQGLDAIILNPTGIIGPYDFEPSYLGKALLHMAHGHLPALVSAGFNWVDARDVASAAIQASQHGKTGESYLISGHWRSIEQIAALVAEFSGKLAPGITVPLWLAAAGLPFTALHAALTQQANIFTRATLMALRSNRCIDHSKASQQFNYQPRQFEETIFDTLQWFSDHGYLHSTTLIQRIRRGIL
jgi:dihydroflavonol-4-reductase